MNIEEKIDALNAKFDKLLEALNEIMEEPEEDEFGPSTE